MFLIQEERFLYHRFEERIASMNDGFVDKQMFLELAMFHENIVKRLLLIATTHELVKDHADCCTNNKTPYENTEDFLNQLLHLYRMRFPTLDLM